MKNKKLFYHRQLSEPLKSTHFHSLLISSPSKKIRQKSTCLSNRLHSSNGASLAYALPSQSSDSLEYNRTNHCQSSLFRFQLRQMSLLYTTLGTPKNARVDGITSTANAATCTSDLRALAAERRRALGEADSARRLHRRMSSTDIMSTRSVQMQSARFVADEAIRLGWIEGKMLVVGWARV